MKHNYKRRTLDEATELAQEKFKASVLNHLSSEEVEEFRSSCLMTSGNPSEIWESVLGEQPDIRMYYEIELYKPSDTCPYIEKSYAKILVSRDRSSEQVEIIWKPEVPEYNGPWFS